MANVANEAALIAARRGANAVSMVDFDAASDRVIGGLEKKNKVQAATTHKLCGSQMRQTVCNLPAPPSLTVANASCGVISCRCCLCSARNKGDNTACRCCQALHVWQVAYCTVLHRSTAQSDLPFQTVPKQLQSQPRPVPCRPLARPCAGGGPQWSPGLGCSLDVYLSALQASGKVERRTVVYLAVLASVCYRSSQQQSCIRIPPWLLQSSCLQ